MAAERVQLRVCTHQPIRSRYARAAATKSPIVSPPNFSCAARASSHATAASATTASASTAATSERSTSAWRGLAGREVDRAERLHQRRQRLHRGADDDLLAVRDAGLDPAGVVRRAAPVGADLVVRLRAELAGEREAVADLDALHGLDPHHARRRAARRGGRPSTRRCRARAGRRGRAPRRRRRPCRARRAPRRSARGAAPRRRSTPSTSIADRREQRLRDAAGGDVHGRVPRRGALERVADVVEVVLEDARRGRRGRAAAASPASCPCPCGSPSGGHGLIPHVQFLWSRFRTTSASGVPSVLPVAQAGEHLDPVLLDLLPRRAAVALLAALQVGVDRVAVELEPGREAGDDRDERGPVRLAGGGEAKRHGPRAYGPPRTASRMTATGAGHARPELEALRALADERLEPVDHLAAGRARRRDERRLGCRPASRRARRRSGRRAARRAARRAPASRSRSGRSRSRPAATSPRRREDARVAPEAPARASARRRRRRSGRRAWRRSRRGSPSVLKPSTRPSRKTSVFTASPSASSHAATTAALCGIVTFAPAKPSVRERRDRRDGILDVERRVVPVEPGRGEGGVLHPRRERVRDRMAEQRDVGRHECGP